MTDRAGTLEGRTPLARMARPIQWTLLLVASAFFGTLLFLIGIPAALLLGPMAAAIVAAIAGATVRIPQVPYSFSQAVIGVLIAASITPDILRSFLQEWPLYLLIVALIIAASSTLGWLMSRWRVLPGTTAVWGSAPGASTAMMLMAEAFGADARLVAFMQYLRILFVAVAASLMARFWAGGGGDGPQIDWFPVIEWPALGSTIVLAAAGAVIGKVLKIPAGPLLVPMGVGILANLTGLVRFQLPEWLLILCYAMLGWRIGLGFTRQVLGHAWRAVPKIVASILVLQAFCGGLAACLVWLLGLDPVTAYLATSPGGLDSVAIIAASTDVDLPFVLALQTVRFLIVLVAGPPIARLIASKTAGDPA